MLVCSIAGTGAASWAGDAGTEDRDTAGGGDGSFTKYIVFDDADSTGRQVELAVLGGIVGVAAMVVGAGSLRKISILPGSPGDHALAAGVVCWAPPGAGAGTRTR